jgi:hypothetical protein
MIVGFAIRGILQGVTLSSILILLGHIEGYFFAKPTFMPIMVCSITGRMMRRNYIFDRTEMNAAGAGE